MSCCCQTDLITEDKQMSLTTKEQLNADTINYTIKLLMVVVESSASGDLTLAHSIGIDTKLLHNLENLSARELEKVARQYVKITSSQLMTFNSNELQSALNSTSVVSSDAEKVDKFILKGACNASLMELFGWQTANLSGRRSVLGYKAKRGRAYQPTQKAKDDIYHAWLDLMHTDNDYADKIYECAVMTNYDISVVFKLVKQFERLSAISSKTSHQSLHRYII